MSQVGFRNSTSSKLFVAYMRRDFGCRDLCGLPWDVLGWINLDPGEIEYRDNPTDNRWYYYYAESADGRIWNGPNFADVNTTSAFQKCACIGIIIHHSPNPWHSVGFRVLDLDQFSGVNFI